MLPLQSLSLPSQISALGKLVWLQPFCPPKQLVCPWAHGVFGFCPGTAQGCPAPGNPSSTVPLQSSSSPLHVSDPGCRFATHAICPPVHFSLPAEQMPCNDVVHAAPTSDGLSSTTPSQLLSLPSHISGDAGRFATHLRTPVLQCVVPGAHSPSLPGTSQAVPPPGSPSSFTPLQLSSRPLHSSGFCLHDDPSLPPSTDASTSGGSSSSLASYPSTDSLGPSNPGSGDASAASFASGADTSVGLSAATSTPVSTPCSGSDEASVGEPCCSFELSPPPHPDAVNARPRAVPAVATRIALRKRQERRFMQASFP
jgi:hypothetical protein